MCSIYKHAKILLLSFSMLIGIESRSQNFFASVFAGSSNYSGELQEKPFTFNQSNLAFGVGLLFEANAKLLIRGDFTYGRISASDEFSSKNKIRNLSFFSYLYEYSLGAEYVLLDLYRYRVSPYLMTGISLYDFNPFTKDSKGNKIMLAELSTEGQGFFDGRKDYKLRQFSIPFGGGFQWAINDNKRIGFVLGFRKTFTDYLDDVSTTYVDELVLAANRGQKSADIAYRSDELPGGGPYPAGGTPRGNPKSKDWYYFTGLTFRMRLTPKKREIEFRYDTKKSRKSRMECPKIY